MEHFQVGILGGGPGGYLCALRASQLGLSVILIEGKRVGGTCLNVGCIPTKVMVKSAQLWREFSRAEEFGIAIENKTFDFAKISQRKEVVVETLVNGVEKLLAAAKVRLVEGWGEFKEAGYLEALTAKGVEKFRVDNIVLATGSVPVPLHFSGIDLPGVQTSDEILNDPKLPASLVIIGGGVIGMEFAGIYSAFGTKVTVLEMLPGILPNVDAEVAKRMNPYFKRQGIEILSKTTVQKISASGNNLKVHVVSSKGESEMIAERVLLATGRVPTLKGIDCEVLGLQTEKKAIVVNKQMETNLPGVYAVGDVVGGLMLAHVAYAEGVIAAENIAGFPAEMNYEVVPSAIFTYPEIATVGKTEQELKNGGVKYKVGKFPFAANGKALASGETLGIVKLLADEEGILLGATIIGPEASNLIQEIVLAIEQKMTGDQLAHIIHAHPTLPEAVMEAAYGIMGKPLHFT